MSGIAGMYYLDNRSVDQADLNRMVETLAHRGPDDAGVWQGGSVGFGHRMLWITPESSHEKLPLVSQSGQVVLTADVRLDNRTELMANLGLSNRAGPEVGDAELILAAYEAWGEACPEQLIGAFAFAIWDKRQQQLFCARDSFGFKPFYYYHSHKLFAFASDIQAILCLADVPRRLNEVKVGDFLARCFEDKTITFYKDIIRLPPATCLTISRQDTKFRKYWEPDLAYELKLHSDDEYTEAFREVFTAAVRSQLRSAFPVGSTLSGGLDSSSVACTANKILTENGRQRLHTFSAIFPSLAEVDSRIDERRFIETVLASGEFEPFYIRADCLSPLVEDFWQTDEVIPGLNLYMDHAFFRVANQHGIRSLLTGHDGDTILSYGWERLPELARTLRWKALFDESAMLARRYGRRRRHIIWNAGFKPLFSKHIPRLWPNRDQQNQTGWDPDLAINPVFAQQINLNERLMVLSGSDTKLRYTVREEHWNGINSGVMVYGTELLDKIGALFAVEPRHPFFDRRVVEFSLALPLDQKLRQGWPRAILRHSMADRLPRQVQWRKSKGDLSANFNTRLLKKGQKILEQVIFDDPAIIEKYVDIQALRRAYRHYMSQPLQQDKNAITVSISVILALWLRNSGLTS